MNRKVPSENSAAATTDTTRSQAHQCTSREDASSEQEVSADRLKGWYLGGFEDRASNIRFSSGYLAASLALILGDQQWSSFDGGRSQTLLPPSLARFNEADRYVETAIGFSPSAVLGPELAVMALTLGPGFATSVLSLGLDMASKRSQQAVMRWEELEDRQAQLLRSFLTFDRENHDSLFRNRFEYLWFSAQFDHEAESARLNQARLGALQDERHLWNTAQLYHPADTMPHDQTRSDSMQYRHCPSSAGVPRFESHASHFGRQQYGQDPSEIDLALAGLFEEHPSLC